MKAPDRLGVIELMLSLTGSDREGTAIARGDRSFRLNQLTWSEQGAMELLVCSLHLGKYT